MGSALIVLLVLLVIVVFAVMVVIGMYNGLVTLRNRYKNAFSQIDVQLKRRYDLIPNLVEVAKGYIKHERETLEAVVTARNAAYSAGQQAARNPGDPTAMTALGGAEGQLTGALGRLFAVAEAYPDLKANQNMMALQEELSADGEQDRLRPAGLQRLGHGLQHQAGSVSHVDHRRDVQLPGGPSVRGRAAGRAGSPEGLVHVDDGHWTHLPLPLGEGPGVRAGWSGGYGLAPFRPSRLTRGKCNHGTIHRQNHNPRIQVDPVARRVRVGDVNVLIGANGSGKSNFVSFFSLLREMVEGRLQWPLTRPAAPTAHLFLGPKITRGDRREADIWGKSLRVLVGADR